ncbi:hypothetical protein HMI54_006395 [Coelomomyces lativittatus]|nr:hypothetical protein HMI54_006395 [Coelomomyces lativittatus]
MIQIFSTVLKDPVETSKIVSSTSPTPLRTDSKVQIYHTVYDQISLKPSVTLNPTELTVSANVVNPTAPSQPSAAPLSVIVLVNRAVSIDVSSSNEPTPTSILSSTGVPSA